MQCFVIGLFVSLHEKGLENMAAKVILTNICCTNMFLYIQEVNDFIASSVLLVLHFNLKH